jgi:hypothetical protein
VAAAAFFAVSPFEIFYGSEARSYSLVAGLIVLSTLSLLLALQQRRARWWALYAVAATAALYTHYIAALTLLPQAAWALWVHRESLREQLIANALVVLAFAPWLPSLVVQIRHSADEAKRLAVLAPVTLSNVVEISARALVGHPFIRLRDLPGQLPLVLLGAMLIGCLILLAYEGRTGTAGLRFGFGNRGGLVILLAAFPLAALVLYGLRPDTSFLLARNLSGAVPYALLLFGWLVTRAGPRLGAALAVLALAVLLVGTVKSLDPDHQRPDARGAARYIDAHAARGAPVVDVRFPYKGPPSRATRLYLERPHRLYKDSEWLLAWRAASRSRLPLFVSMPRLSNVIRLFSPPVRYESRYRLVAEHVSRGLRPILTREYAPR